MKFSEEKKERYVLINLEEEKLDTTVAPELKSEFVKIHGEGIKNIILNLEKTKYIDSSGLSAVLVANRLCDNANGQLVICCVSDHVMKLFSISQLESVINILPTKEEAIDAIFMNDIENDLKSNDTEKGE